MFQQILVNTTSEIQRIWLLNIAKDLVLSRQMATTLKEVLDMAETLEKWINGEGESRK